MRRLPKTLLVLPCLLFLALILEAVNGFSVAPSFETRNEKLPERVSVSLLSDSGLRQHEPTTKNNPQQQLHLLSLQYTPTDDSLKFSETVTSIWRWKDSVLGNGQDFFVPKPKTLQKLQECLIMNANMDEAVIISNCARLEILVVCDGDPKEMISRELLHQVQYHQAHPHRIQLGFGWDVPACIDAGSAAQRETVLMNALRDLTSHWNHMMDPAEIAHHLCLVASGMAPRPRRPDRPVPFQPFSSRDAHVLLQLKRTLDICIGKQTSILLKGALEAGKAVRNVKVVPELQQLRAYGTGDSKKYSTEPPIHILESVTLAAMAKGIQPVVLVTLERLHLVQNKQLTRRIAMFRRQAEALALNPEERTWIRQRLHEPTMRLRDGSKSVCVETILAGLQQELEVTRASSRKTTNR